MELRGWKEKRRHTRKEALFHERVQRVVNIKLWLYDAMWWYAIGRALVPDALSWIRGKLAVQQTAYFGRQWNKERDVLDQYSSR